MRTKITELIGIEYPIIQAGMNYGAYPSLVAAVSNAGSLGILGAGSMDRETLKRNINTIRDMTDRPFGVNLLATSPILDELIEVLIEEKVPLASYGRGDPKKIIERTKPHGILNMPTVGAVKHAVRVESYGADAIIVQGMEGGGHTSYLGTTVLVPLVATAVKIPVVAAGGFCDGKGLVSALALGAEGISMGTRFALTKESSLPEKVKRSYITASGEDAIITERVTGTRCRGLLNKMVKMIEEDKHGLDIRESISSLFELSQAFNVPLWKVILSGIRMKKAYQIPAGQLGNAAAGSQRIKKALIEADLEWGFMPCGQVCGRIDDIPTCQELIQRVMNEADYIISRLSDKRD